MLLCAMMTPIWRDMEHTAAFMPSNIHPVVVIDPGHGGEDGGAVGAAGAREAKLNLAIAQRLSDLLGFCGVDTVMTRTDDVSIHSGDAASIRQKKASDIKNRVAIVEQCEHPRLISVHLNHFSQASCHGAQVFYSIHHDSGKQFADLVQQALREGLDPENHRVAKPGEPHIYLLEHVTCPAILVECGFLSNPLEERKLGEENYQRRIALCIASGYLIAEKTVC